jgi:hypothetical protein
VRVRRSRLVNPLVWQPKVSSALNRTWLRLIRQVAAYDITSRGTAHLADYYGDRGEIPKDHALQDLWASTLWAPTPVRLRYSQPIPLVL